MGGNLNMSQEFINLKKMHKDTEDLNKVLTQLNLMERSTFKKITHFFFNSWKLYKMSCKIPKVNLSVSHSVMSDSLWPHGLQPSRLLCPWGFSRQEYWRGYHALLQGIFPTQGSNPGLPHCRRILYHLSHKGTQYWRLGIYKRWPLHNFHSLRIYSLEDKNDAQWIRIVYYSLLLLLQVTETNLS